MTANCQIASATSVADKPSAFVSCLAAFLDKARVQSPARVGWVVFNGVMMSYADYLETATSDNQ